MGTRNLTIVKSKGKTKVAQYGQWDGYPTGQGQTIADFIKKVDIEKFKKLINALGEYTEADIKKAYEEAGVKPNDEWISSEISEKKNRAHPALCRDHGAGILELIYNGEVSKVKLDEEFKEDGLFCEYYYIIDLDNETVTMNGGKPFTFKAWTRKGKMEQLENKENEE